MISNGPTRVLRGDPSDDLLWRLQNRQPHAVVRNGWVGPRIQKAKAVMAALQHELLAAKKDMTPLAINTETTATPSHAIDPLVGMPTVQDKENFDALQSPSNKPQPTTPRTKSKGRPQLAYVLAPMFPIFVDKPYRARFLEEEEEAEEEEEEEDDEEEDEEEEPPRRRALGWIATGTANLLDF